MKMALILPIITFFLIFQILKNILYSKNKDFSWRECILLAAVFWGFLLVIITELLSLFNLITFPGIAGAWGCSSLIGVFIYISKRNKKTLMRRSGVTLSLSRAEIFLLICVTLVVLVLALAAYIAPPNTWDSLWYHMGRVVHWMQNKNVNYYPTQIIPQLVNAPFSEFAILHLQVLSGQDRFANFVQWFSMIGSLIGVSLITKLLGGGNPRKQVFAAVITATIPMGILQATSTQTDYVTSFWLVCFVFFLMRLIRRPGNMLYSVITGMSLGLALLTKHTAYFYALPFLIWYLLAGLKNLKVKAARSFLIIGLFAILINAGFYMRNYDLSGDILGRNTAQDHVLNTSFAPKSIFSNIVRHISLHTFSPFESMNKFSIMGVEKAHTLLNIDISDPHTTANKSYFPVGFTLSEDHTGNFLHFMLALIATLLFLFSRRGRENRDLSNYATALAFSFILLCLMLKWQSFASRFHLALFVLGAPFIALALPEDNPLRGGKITAIIAWITLFIVASFLLIYSNYGFSIIQRIYNGEVGGFFNNFMTQKAGYPLEFYLAKADRWFREFQIISAICLIVLFLLLKVRKLTSTIGCFLILCAIPWIFFNPKKIIIGKENIFNTDRIYQYAGIDFLNAFKNPVDFIVDKKCSDIGLISDKDCAEYLFWVVIPEKNKKDFRLEQIFVDNISSKKAQKEYFRRFEPCAIIAARPIQGSEITWKGRIYKKEWSGEGWPVYAVYMEHKK